MVGDVNLFLSKFEPESDSDEDIELVLSERIEREGHGNIKKEDLRRAYRNSCGALQGEINVMIAEPEARRKGFAAEALRLMMHYGAFFGNFCDVVR